MDVAPFCWLVHKSDSKGETVCHEIDIDKDPSSVRLLLVTLLQTRELGLAKGELGPSYQW
jgi:hypothetical protein